MLRAVATFVLLAALMISCGGPTKDELLAKKESQKFQQIVDTYVQEYFTDHPQRATEAGLHQYDGQMPAFTRDHLVGHTNRLKETLNKLAALETKRLDADERFDSQIVENKIRGELLDLSDIRRWLRDPNAYNDLVLNSLLSLTRSHSIDAADRMKAAISRLDSVPDALAAMQSNIENPAALSVDIAKEEFAKTAAFLRDDLRKAFADVQDKALQDKLQASSERAGKAYAESLKFLSDLGRKARGGYSLGTRFFQQRTFFEEMVDTPVPKLAEMGEAEMKRVHDEMDRVAKKIDSRRTAAQVLEDVAKDHPSSDELTQTASSQVEQLRKFVAEKNLLTIPSDETPKVRTLAPFTGGLRFARLDNPGLAEKTTTSFYTVTLPDASWPPARKEQHLRALNRSLLPLLSIHEIYPGHYVQFLYARQAPSKVRKLFGSEAFREGWASYAEEMMLDEGYAGGDAKIRLSQLQLALVRAARFVAVVRIHGQGTMSDKDAVNFFMKEANLSKDDAEREAKRAAIDPSVINHALGRIEIVRLRDDYKQAKGAAFSAQEFHNNLLKHGYPPLKIVREILLPSSNGKKSSS